MAKSKKDTSAIVSALGVLMSIITALVSAVRKQGGTDADIYRLATPEGESLIEKIATLIVQVGNFKRDMRKEGWTLLENQSRRINNQIIGVPFLRGSESYIHGEDMVRRARELDAVHGQEDAEWLLEHQDQIPTELREYYLVFPGTVWQDAGGGRYVPYLFWYGDRWILNFDWLDFDWNSSGRLVRPRK